MFSIPFFSHNGRSLTGRVWEEPVENTGTLSVVERKRRKNERREAIATSVQNLYTGRHASMLSSPLPHVGNPEVHGLDGPVIDVSEVKRRRPQIKLRRRSP